MNIAVADQTKLLMKYIPEGQPSPKGFIELVKSQVLGTTKNGEERSFDDLLYFLHVCKRTGLDPLAKQIYAVYRWDSRIGAEKIVVQTSIDGLRLIAQRSKQYGGQDDIKFTPEDETTKYPIKATATVYIVNLKTGERMPVTATARWSEYAQYDSKQNLIGLWGKMPYNQLGKCAEALALRKAFPAEMSGIYAEDEIKPENTLELSKPEKINGKVKEIEQSKEEAKAEEPKEPVISQEVDIAGMRQSIKHE